MTFVKKNSDFIVADDWKKYLLKELFVVFNGGTVKLKKGSFIPIFIIKILGERLSEFSFA